MTICEVASLQVFVLKLKLEGIDNAITQPALPTPKAFKNMRYSVVLSLVLSGTQYGSLYHHPSVFSGLFKAWTDVCPDGWMARPTDRRTDGQTDGWTEIHQMIQNTPNIAFT